MTPAQRFYPEILRLVASVYEVTVDDLTAEDLVRNPILRKVVAEVTVRSRGAVQDFRLFGVEAAE